jgi:hypothetical protein
MKRAKKRKRGEVREDGYRFLGYYKRKRKDGSTVVLEKWISPAGYARSLKQIRDWHRKHRAAQSAYNKEWRAKNIEKSRAYTKKWAEQNKEKVAAKNKRWAENNPDAVKAKSRKYYHRHPGKIKARRDSFYKENKTYFRDYAKRKLATDSNFKLATYMRNRIRSVLTGRRKTAPSLDLLGCSLPELRLHLEEQFTAKMSWANYGTYWHVDHVRPLASFDLSKPKDQRVAFHWTNLQPLTAVENLRKGKRAAAGLAVTVKRPSRKTRRVGQNKSKN